MTVKSYDEHLSEILESYQFHNDEASRLRRLLEAAGMLPSKNSHPVTASQLVIPKIKLPDTKKNKKNKGTFEEIIVDLLKELGEPRATKDLYEDFRKRTHSDIIAKNFSSKLSIAAKSKKRIKNIFYEEYPADRKYIWGLSDWTSGDKFKDEYHNKIAMKFAKEDFVEELEF